MFIEHWTSILKWFLNGVMAAGVSKENLIGKTAYIYIYIVLLESLWTL